MKKIIITFFACIIALLSFGQANTYFHDRIDTTLFAIADTVGHGANTYYATNASPDFNVKQYENGFTVNLFFKKGNTGSATLTLITKTGTLSQKTVRKAGGQILISGDIPDSTAVILDYYNGSFRIAGIGVMASSSSWLLTGNAGTIAGTNFLGTTDNVPLSFRVNNQNCGKITVTPQNNFLGHSSGNSITSGTEDNGIGDESLFSTTSGASNNAFGSDALRANTTGSVNTGIGENALLNNSTGNGNTALGNSAGQTNTIGTNNTFIGYLTDAGSNNLTNATAIGYNTQVTISNSLILGTGANVGIGTSSPSSKLHIVGDARFGLASTTNASLIFQNSTNANTITINSGITSASYALTLPTAQGAINTVPTNNGSGVLTWAAPVTTATAWQLLGNAGTVDGTNFIGTTDAIPFNIRVGNVKSGRIDNTLGNVFYGGLAGASISTGNTNTALGAQSSQSLTIATGNTSVGYLANGSDVSGSGNTAIGSGALHNNTGGPNTAIGNSALSANTSAQLNTACGTNALNGTTTGEGNVGVGPNTGTTNTTGTNNTFIGLAANAGSNALTNATALGYNTTVSASNSLVLGNGANVGIGTSTPTSKLHIFGTSATVATSPLNISNSGSVVVLKVYDSGQIDVGGINSNLYFGQNSGLNSNGADAGNISIGKNSSFSMTGGGNNVVIGMGALYTNTTTSQNIAIGSNVLQASTQNDNNGVGFDALYSNTTGTRNDAFGFTTLFSHSTGDYNTSIGSRSMYSNTSGTQNTALGNFSMYANVSGNGNVCIGYQAGSNFLGSNTLFIDNQDRGSAANELIKALVVGTYNANPALQTYTVNSGGVAFPYAGTPAIGKVFTSDASGNGTWQSEGQLLHTISTPTTAATVTLTVDYMNIVNPSGTIAALTLKFPNSPSNNDFVWVTFEQIVTAVTYSAGTGAATIDGQINGIVGGQKRWDYDTGTNTWYYYNEYEFFNEYIQW